MLAELGGRLAALLRGFGRDRAAALEPGAPAAMDGGAAVALVEERLGSVEARSLGEGVGLALAGRRVAAVIGEWDVPSLAGITEHCAPMVAWLPLPSSHTALHAAAGSGWVQLMAGSVQEAVDLASVAHLVAERTLVPVLVGVDGPEVWEGIATVLLPSLAGLDVQGDGEAGLGLLPPGQRLIFGETRDRVPRWFDPDRPLAQGGARFGEAAAIAAVSRSLFLDAAVGVELDQALAQLGARTGRARFRCEAWRVADAEVVIVAQGVAAQTARAVAERLRAQGPKVGVLAVNCLRPFPADAVAAALGDRRVVVLERLADRLESPPLLGEVRAAIAGKRPPRALESASWGIGGTPLCPGDLASLCRDVAAGGRGRRVLGVDTSKASTLPKREARLQELHGAFPALEGAGLRVEVDETPRHGWTLGVASRSTHVHVAAREAAASIQGMVGGHLAGTSASLGEGRLDLVTVASTPDPGPSLLADVLLVTDAALLSASLPHLAPGGAVVVAWTGEATCLAEALPASAGAAIRRLGASIATLATLDPTGLLGGALSTAIARGHLPAEPRSLRVRVDAMLEGLGGLQPVDVAQRAGPSTGAAPPRPSVRAAAARSSAPASSLSVFLDQVVAGGALTPDPLHATGLLPPLSSAFHDHRGDRATFPVLNPAACTGCGRCWVACPDSSVGVTALEVPRVLERAMELCTRDGTRADVLRPILGKLAAEVVSGMGTADAHFSEVLAARWGPVRDRVNPTAERRVALDSAFEAVASRLAPLHAVRCAPFFGATPADLLVVAFDPDACKGCGACAAVCAPGAITMEAQATEPLAAARAQWRLWEELPDTNERTVARVKDSVEVGPLAALELSRHFGMAMAGGDEAEPGSGARLSMRSFFAVAEATLQRDQLARVAMVDVLVGRLAEKAKLRTADSGPHRRLTEAARLVSALRATLAGGPTGLGRSRLGLVVAQDEETAWIAAFPNNPFAVPVQVVAAAAAVDVARGLCRAMGDTALEEARLLRWARVVVERPEDADEVATKLRSLAWSDLTPEERSAAPAVVLVGSATTLDGALFPALAGALLESLPLRVLTLDRLAPAGRDVLPLLTLARDRAMIVAASVGAPAHFVSSVSQALSHDGPAVIRVHAPSPVAEGFARSEALPRMEAAVADHTFPIFRYDPRRPGVFGSRLEMDGNPPGGSVGSPSWRVLQELAGVVTPFTARIREQAERDADARAQLEIAAVRAAAVGEVAAARERVTAELGARVRERLVTLAGYGRPGGGSADV